MVTKKKRTTKASKTSTAKAKKTAATKPKLTKSKAKTKTKTKAKAVSSPVAKKTQKKATAKAVPTSSSANVIKFPSTSVTEKQTKAQIYSDIAESTGLSKTEVKNVFAALRNLVERHLKGKGSGQFSIPELGVKIRRVSKKATKSRKGRNPFTGEEITIPAKPARKAIRATILKNLKEII